jgi:hypothetical protein
VAVVVETLDGGVGDGAGHAVGVAVGSRMIDFHDPVLDALLSVSDVEHGAMHCAVAPPASRGGPLPGGVAITVLYPTSQDLCVGCTVEPTLHRAACKRQLSAVLRPGPDSSLAAPALPDSNAPPFRSFDEPSRIPKSDVGARPGERQGCHERRGDTVDDFAFLSRVAANGHGTHGSATMRSSATRSPRRFRTTSTISTVGSTFRGDFRVPSRHETANGRRTRARRASSFQRLCRPPSTTAGIQGFCASSRCARTTSSIRRSTATLIACGESTDRAWWS